jgi:hypothetical protein
MFYPMRNRPQRPDPRAKSAPAKPIHEREGELPELVRHRLRLARRERCEDIVGFYQKGSRSPYPQGLTSVLQYQTALQVADCLHVSFDQACTLITGRTS